MISLNVMRNALLRETHWGFVISSKNDCLSFVELIWSSDHSLNYVIEHRLTERNCKSRRTISKQQRFNVYQANHWGRSLPPLLPFINTEKHGFQLILKRRMWRIQQR